MKVPQHLIDEATRKGIGPGAVVKCAYIISNTFTVPHWDDIEYGTHISTVSFVDVKREGSANGRNYGYLKFGGTWATVITPAPSQGLEEGMATECSPAMRAAIVELAKELGLPDSGCLGQGLPYLVWWTGQLSSYHHGREAKVKLAPEDFIAKMRATAKKPKPIKIGNDVVEFRKGGIRVGCTTVDNETVRAIAANLKD